MTFDEVLEQIKHDYINPETVPDGSKDADGNGHRRLADLQKKYHLSSLKVQKLLVTAGVYEPVKTGSSFYSIKRLYESGKSMEQIMEQLHLSRAVVNASIPYKRGAKEQDKLGAEITGDAVRKRKQRSGEETRKENARKILAEKMSDEALWYSLKEHDNEIFLTASGYRFGINTYVISDEENDEPPEESVLSISMYDANGEKGEIITIPRSEVIEAYHKALEERAGSAEHGLGSYDEFFRPVFVYLGVLEGDKEKVTTRRAVPISDRCACCGRLSDTLYMVSSFEDLVSLDARFEEERKAAFSEDEKQTAKTIDFMMREEQAYWAERKKRQLEKARASKAVQAFDAEGERKFCKLCCQTIYGALEDGDIPTTTHIAGFGDLPDQELLDFIFDECEEADCAYFQVHDGVYKADEFDNSSMFLYKVMDGNSVIHSFALTVTRIPYPEGGTGISFRALEVHRLTKAGKVAADHTNTDYDICHFRVCSDEECFEHLALVGLVELMEKIKDTIRTQTLTEDHRPVSNNIEINGHYYQIGPIGTIVPTYVRNAKHYRSMKNREWDGGEYGLMIDGKLFSGSELALMLSSFEGWQLKFYMDDPNSEALQSDEMLMTVKLNQRALVDETVELMNMFTADGRFGGKKDRENFDKLFEKDVLAKLKLYYESRPRGYGRLAGMEIVKRLQMAEGTGKYIDEVKRIIGA